MAAHREYLTEGCVDTGPTLKLPDDMLRYPPDRFTTACGFVRRLILDQVMKSQETCSRCKHAYATCTYR